MQSTLEIAAVLCALVFFSVVSLKKKSLDRKGIIIANIVGLLIFLLGSFFDFVLIVVFFVVSELCTRYARNFQKEKHEVRTTGNILGNSGAAVIALILHSEIGFFGAVSAALADTLSSEIGLLSKKKPVLITTLKTVPAGTDGGITLLGCTAAVIGAAIIGAMHYLVFANALAAGTLVVAGLFGSLSDSVAGALFERKGGLNNAEVNFIGSSTGGIIAFVLSKLLRF